MGCLLLPWAAALDPLMRLQQSCRIKFCVVMLDRSQVCGSAPDCFSTYTRRRCCVRVGGCMRQVYHRCFAAWCVISGRSALGLSSIAAANSERCAAAFSFHTLPVHRSQHWVKNSGSSRVLFAEDFRKATLTHSCLMHRNVQQERRCRQRPINNHTQTPDGLF